MLTDFTFRDVCKLLKHEDGKLLEAADSFLALGIIFTPVIVGPQAMPVLALLKAKDELVKLGQGLLHIINDGKKPYYLGCAERMQAAYGLICFTAFFDALDHLLPADLRKKIELSPKEKEQIASRPKKRSTGHEEETDANGTQRMGIIDNTLPFPHPAVPFEEQMAHLEPMYKSMANGFGEFVKKLAVWEKADEKGKAQFRTVVEKIPKAAMQCFEGQYIELAKTYPDFCIWSRLHEQKATQAKVKKLSDYIDKHARLLANSEKKIDVGFSSLHDTVRAMPLHFQEVAAHAVVERLKQHYQNRIAEPIIEDEAQPEEDKPALVFPKISDAFVPQSYRILLHTAKDRHLEKEETWDDLKAQHDLGAFLLSYLSSPYSIESPLLVLGHPGSGKSLLTKVLCARLMSESYTPIRVPLRNVNVDSTIAEQILQGIKLASNNSTVNSWPEFSNQFRDRPLVVLLDGYDELLQASGHVFAGYLGDVQKFQHEQIVHESPVRIIVTSRVALIDKATVPRGATVIRLLDFNQEQQTKWIDIWNKANADYFDSCEPPIEPFSLPEFDTTNEKEKRLLDLGRQPLLLLMLALYDSEDNRLKKEKNLDRTELYDSLLRRFVLRERRKNSKEFDGLAEKTRKERIEKEMTRLGAAAIGMYNRNQFHICESELDRDIRYFSLQRGIPAVDGRRSAQESDLLLGSFFFIHKSKAGQKGDGEGQEEGDTAFEFLHNTFGEFLTADFVLRHTLSQTETLHAFKTSEELQAELHKKLHDPNGLDKEWFACLMYTPLYSKPVVLDMLREWCRHLLKRRKRSRDDFLLSLDDILRSQIGMILRARSIPAILSSDDAMHFADKPMLAHVAIYVLNLITLRIVLDPTEFVLDEDYYSLKEEKSDSDTSKVRPWDVLTHLWRSCFSIDNLSGLTAVFTAKRDGSKIIFGPGRSFQASPSVGRLETVLNVASSLADNITAGLAALPLPGSGTNEVAGLVQAKERLESENIHLDFEFLVRQLWLSLSSSETDTENVSQLVMTGLEQCFDERHRAELVVEFLHLVVDLVKRRRVSFRCERDIRREFLGGGGIHPGRFMEMRPGIVVEWLRLLHELGVLMWMDDFPHKGGFFEEFFHRTMHPKCLTEMMKMSPEVAIEWLRLARESGGERWMERFGKEGFFEEVFHGPMHPERFMEMMEMRPDVAVEWLRLARESGGERWMERFGKEGFFEEVFHGPMHPKRFMEMMEMRPDIAIEWFRLVREFGGGRWLERFGKEGFFEEVFHGPMHPRYFMEMMEMRPEVALGWIRLAREFGDTHWIERFGKESEDSAMRLHVAKVPLESLGDIRWFAEVTHNESLLKEIGALLQ